MRKNIYIFLKKLDCSKKPIPAIYQVNYISKSRNMHTEEVPKNSNKANNVESKPDYT